MVDSTNKVDMVDPDGKKWSVAHHSVQDAMDQGWKTEEQLSTDKAIAGKNAPGFQEGDVLDTIARKFLDTATLGVAPIIEKALDNRSPEIKAIVEARKAASEEEAPISTMAASAAGFAGSLLTGGGEGKILGTIGKALPGALAKGVGELAEKAIIGGAEKSIAPISEIAEQAAGAAVANQAKVSAGRQLAATVTKNMAMAEAFNAPSQIANVATGNTDQAAESLGWTLGLGGLVGAGEHGFSKVLGPAIAKGLDRSAIANHGIDISKLQKGSTQSDDILNLIKRAGGKVNPQEVIDDKISKIQPFRDLLDNSDMDTKLTGTQQDVADKLKLGSQDISPISDHIGVNPDSVLKDIQNNVYKTNPLLQNSPIFANQLNDFTNVINSFDDAGAAPTSFKNIDELKAKINALPEGEVFTKVKGKDMTIKDIANQYIEKHENAQMTAGLNSLGDTSKISEYAAHKKDLDTARLMQDPSLQLKQEPLQIGSAIGGAIGGVLGGVLGHPFLGAYVGSGGNPSAAKGIISAITKRTIMPFATKSLSKLADAYPEMFGNAIARASNDAVDSHFSQIKNILISGGKNLPIRSSDALASFLGDEATGLSKDQQYTRVVNNITNGASNPESIVENVGALTSVFGDNPHLQNLISQHNLNAITYLNSIVPKNPNPVQGFSKNEWQPSSKQKADFINQLAIVDNPMIAVHKAAAGTLTSKEVTTLQTVYPTLYQKITGEVTKASFATDAHKMANHTKVSSSVLAQQPLVPSLQKQNIIAIQSAYTSAAQPAQGGGKSPHGSSKDRDASGDKLLTSTQKAAQ
jgi:hypothetical protein